MKVLITGASGMVGKGVLLECLDSPVVEQVLSVGRSKIDIQHSKLKQFDIPDFMDLSQVEGKLGGYDACFFCVGVSSIGMEEDTYRRLTYDLTLEFASAFLADNPKSSFIYVSGKGTDRSEKGKVMWARVKGATENQIDRMGFEDAYFFRPNYIQPLRGIRSKTGWINVVYSLIGFSYNLFLKNLPAAATDTSRLGRAMIHAIQFRPKLKIYNTREINALAARQD